MTHLLTWHGMLLCRDAATGRLVQRAVSDSDSAPIRLPLAWDRLRSDFDRVGRVTTEPMKIALTGGDAAGLELRIAGDRRTVSLVGADGVLLAQPDGQTGFAADDASPNGGNPGVGNPGVGNPWAQMLPVTEPDLEMLRAILANAWVVRATLRVLPRGALRLGAGHTLRWDGAAFDLRYQLPFDLSDTPFRVTLLRDGWRIEQLCLFRPVVYYVALTHPDTLAQLWLSLRSLLELADYTGHVHLLTDRTAPEVLAQVPLLEAARLSVQRLAATDRVGATAAKFSIVDWPGAKHFQPMLFVDTDTVFDRDITPMLATIAASDRICAPVEEFSPMRSAPSAGAQLLEADGINPCETRGFNSGTLGIPNLRGHGHNLRLVRRIIANRAELLGRRSFSWVDQPVANYVSYRLAQVDTHLLNRFVRYGFAGVERDGANRTGLVHFWPPRGSALKLVAMRTYLQTLGMLVGP